MVAQPCKFQQSKRLKPEKHKLKACLNIKGIQGQSGQLRETLSQAKMSEGLALAWHEQAL